MSTYDTPDVDELPRWVPVRTLSTDEVEKLLRDIEAPAERHVVLTYDPIEKL